MEERKIQLHESDIEEGINTKFWKAVEERLQEFLNDIHIELEDMAQVNDFGVFKRLSGNAETVKRVMALPDIFKDEIEYERSQHATDRGRTERD